MKFLKHILRRWFIIWTLLINGGFLWYAYEFFFNSQSFYESTVVFGTIIVLGVYTAFWLYCIKTFKNK